MSGIALKSSYTEERGLPHDRRWLLVDKDNKSLTQRQHSEMALLEVAIKDKELEVNHKNNLLSHLKIPLDYIHTERIPITIFNDVVVAPLVNDPVIEEWFSNALGEKVKLVFMDAATERKINPDYAKMGEMVSFSDGYPVLVTTQASLNELNGRLDQAVPMDRFRPNLVVGGAKPYQEDNWDQITIGTAVFKVVKPCGRCVVTTINQTTAEKSKEPLKTLSSYRMKNNKVIFGQNLIPLNRGEIKIGDEVKIKYK